MREIRTLRSTWRGLETWHGRHTLASPAHQSSTLLMRGRWGDDLKPVAYSTREGAGHTGS